MKLSLLCLLAFTSLLQSCVTPVVSLHKDPPGVCFGVPVVPVDVCLTLRIRD